MRACFTGLMLLLFFAGGVALLTAPDAPTTAQSGASAAKAATSTGIAEESAKANFDVPTIKTCVPGSYFRTPPRQSELTRWLLSQAGELRSIEFTTVPDATMVVPNTTTPATEKTSIVRLPSTPNQSGDSSRFDEAAWPDHVEVNPPVANQMAPSDAADANAAFNENSLTEKNVLVRLPAIVNVSSEQDIVQFAAGAIEFKVPTNWKVTEAAVHREVRLLVTPQSVLNETQIPVTGFWVTYQATDRPPTAQQAQAWLARRRAQIGDNVQPVGSVVATTIAGQPAWRQQWSWQGEVTSSSGVSPRVETFSGDLIVVSTDWGLVEFLASSPHATVNDVRRGARFSLSSLVLSSPAEPSRSIKPVVADAAEILGTWKAYRSRMRLHGDGRIEMVFDGPRRRQLDVTGSEFNRPPRTITGRFQASDHLLLITWDDDSQLNFRWKTDDGQLLLTDHQGRISQLKRLFE